MGSKKTWRCIVWGFFFPEVGGTLSYGLSGDVPLNRVWLLTSLSHRVYFFVLPARLIWFARWIFVLALILSFVGLIKLRVLSYCGVCILGIFFLTRSGSGFQTLSDSVTHLYPNIGLVPPPPPPSFLLNSLRLRIFGSVVPLHGYILFHFMQVKRRTTV